MSNEKMREDFEGYMNGQGFDVDHIYVNGEFKCYCFAETQNAFEIWKASRAALCVELPQQGVLHHTTTYNAPDVRSALDTAGVRYK